MLSVRLSRDVAHYNGPCVRSRLHQSPVCVVTLITMFGRGGRASRTCVLVICMWSAVYGRSTEHCGHSRFYLFAEHDKRGNTTTVGLRTYHTTTLAVVEDGRLVPLYPWISVSDAEPELTLARDQLRYLLRLADAFPNIHHVSIEYSVGNESDATLLTMGANSVLFNGNTSCRDFAKTKTISAEQVRSFAGLEEFGTFLRSRSSVLKRWRAVCERVFEREVFGDVDMTFVYHPASSTLECTVRIRSPVSYYLTLRCDKKDKQVAVPWSVPHKDFKGDTLTWKNSPCNISGVQCVFGTEDWSKDMFPSIADEYSSAPEAGVVASIVAVPVVSILVLFLCYRYRTSVRPLNDMFTLVRGRRRTFESGYVGGSPC